jgi:hypothetical protein
MYIQGSSMADAAILTLTASRDLEGRRIQASDEFCASIRRLTKLSEPPAGQAFAGVSANEAHETWRMAAQKICSHRAFFHTECMCLGPGSMQSGDLVCVILAASVPFILRERDSDVFQLVGEAYLNGYMDGEALEMWASNKLSLETFSIC